MKTLFSFLLTALFLTSFAQETQKEVVTSTTPAKTYHRKSSKLENPFDKKLDLNHQFDYVYKKSNSYNQYKVIPKTLLNTLRNSITDSIQIQKNTISEKNKDINDSKEQIASLKNELINTQNKLEEAISLKENRSVLGAPVHKTTFSIIIAITYIILFVLLAFFIFKYIQNLSITKKSVNDLNSLEIEFEQHKKSSLTRFQEVNRKLQDELNKNWKKEK